MGHYVYVRNKKTKPSPTGKSDGYWPEKKKLELVTTYLTTGNLSLSAKMCNVPLETVKYWRYSQWWKDTVQSIQDEDTLALDSKLAKIVDKSLEAINDRLDKGDFIYDTKQGVVKRVPAKLRDVQRVTTDLIDRRAIIKKTQPHQKTDDKSTEDRLLKLAESFAEFALGKKKEEKIVNEAYDGEFQQVMEENGHAVHDQWQARLQEGTVLGEEVQAESSQGQSQPEQSEVSGG